MFTFLTHTHTHTHLHIVTHTYTHLSHSHTLTPTYNLSHTTPHRHTAEEWGSAHVEAVRTRGRVQRTARYLPHSLNVHLSIYLSIYLSICLFITSFRYISLSFYLLISLCLICFLLYLSLSLSFLSVGQIYSSPYPVSSTRRERCS